MSENKYIDFSDRLISYDKFADDLAERIVRKLKKDATDPEYISQREAYRIFGYGNVRRWRREGKVEYSKHPGKITYRMADLRRLQRTQQDYL